MNREIFSILDQKVQKSQKWDQTVKEIKEGQEFNKGHFNKQRDKLAEELAIQTVVMDFVIPLLEEIYGGGEDLRKRELFLLRAVMRG